MSMICEVFIVSASDAALVIGEPPGIHELLESLEGSDLVLSLEKSWHGLHFVFTGTSSEGDPPLNFLVSGGAPVGDEDVGYGPARVVDPVDVAALSEALTAFSYEDFVRNFDPACLTDAEIYPQIWDEPIEELKQEYDSYLQQLKIHVRRASESGQAILVVIR